MRPGSCAPVAGAHVHAPVRVRLRHTSAVITVVDDLPVVAAGRSGAGSGAAAVGGATGSGTGVGAAAAVSGAAGWGCGAGSTGDGAGGGAAPVDGSVAAVRSRDGFELNRYHPPTSSRTNTASTAAIAGARDGSPMAAGALSVRGDNGTADDERSGKSSSDGGAAARGGGGAAGFGTAAFGAAGFGGAGGGGAGRGGGADDAAGRCIDDAVGGGTDDAVGGGTDDAVGAGADEAVGAGDEATGGVSLNGMPRAVQNCSRFSRLVVTNGSLAGKLDVAMPCARR